MYAIFPMCEFSYGSSSRLKLHVQSHINCICMIFLQNQFSNASSHCLYEQMQSCIGKDLRTPKNEKMEEYTQKSRYDAACIYKIKAMVSQGNNLPWGRILPNIKFIFGKCNICNFPHCALQMQIHIVCICTIFLQNQFSNASSNCLYEQM